MFNSKSRVCSSTIDAILMALPLDPLQCREFRFGHDQTAGWPAGAGERAPVIVEQLKGG